MKSHVSLICAAAGLALLAGCASQSAVRVEERKPVPSVKAEKPLPAEPESNFHVVQKGETLSRIAAQHKLTVKDLVAWNALENPNKVEVDQRIRIVPPSQAPVAAAAAPAAGEAAVAETRPVTVGAPVEVRPLNGSAPAPATPKAPAVANTELLKREPRAGKQAWSEQALAKAKAAEGGTPPAAPAAAPKPVETKPAEATSAAPVKPEAKTDVKPAGKSAGGASASPDWSWPAEGKVLKSYDGNTSKGVDIAGKLGEPVVAAAGGKVVYAGAGIRGYGKLVILKHDNQFLSAYANNSQILVKEGQKVAKGQKIAAIGKAEGGEPSLHFEIRREGKPTDPVKFLPARE